MANLGAIALKLNVTETKANFVTELNKIIKDLNEHNSGRKITLNAKLDTKAIDDYVKKVQSLKFKLDVNEKRANGNSAYANKSVTTEAEKQVKYLNDLINKTDVLNKKYVSFANTSLGGKLKSDLSALTTAVRGYTTATNNAAEANKNLTDKQIEKYYEKLHNAYEKVIQDTKLYGAEQSNLSKYSKMLDEIVAKTKEYQNNIAQAKLDGFDNEGIRKVDSSMESVQKRAQDLIDKLSTLDTSNRRDVERFVTSVLTLSGAFKDAESSAKDFATAASTEKLENGITTAKEKVEQLKEQLNRLNGFTELKADVDRLAASVGNISSKSDLDKFNSDLSNVSKNVNEAVGATERLKQRFESTFGKVAYMFSLYQILNKTKQVIGEMTNNVRELDKAMVELRKVSNETQSTYERFFSGAKDTAVEIGTTMKDFINSTADFSRLGYNFVDAQELAKVATIYNNVGDDLSGIDEATSTIVSVMKAFDIEASDAITIVDRLNEVSNNFAVSSGDLGDGLARAASALKVSGNTIDEVIAMITGMTEITQNAGAAGLSLRTLALRLRGAKIELEEAGESTDGMAHSVSELREKIRGLTAVNGQKGFDIMLDKDKIIVLVKLTQIGETPGTDNTEDKVQMYYNQKKLKEMYIIDNLINMRFGKWLVLSEDSTPSKDKRWICKCDCGVEKSVLGKYLLSGKSKSCGCLKKKDLTGQRFGKLVVLETIYDFQNKKRATYLCQCDCGNQIYVHSGSIYKTHSCGCSVRKDLSGQRFGKLVVDKMLCDYKKGKTYFSCTCDCGNSNIIVAENALQCGNTTSCGCLHEPNLINKKFGKLFVQEFYGIKKNQRYWKCICECGQERILSSYVLLSGHTESCGCVRSSAVSKSEIKIAEFLKSKNIKFETQKTFDDCSDVRHLHFDFYLTDYNILIEYDGQQHFIPVEYFGGENSFNTLQSHDKIKNEYCISHHITLLRYNYKSTINSILEDINNKINTFENSVTTTVA